MHIACDVITTGVLHFCNRGRQRAPNRYNKCKTRTRTHTLTHTERERPTERQADKPTELGRHYAERETQTYRRRALRIHHSNTIGSESSEQHVPPLSQSQTDGLRWDNLPRPAPAHDTTCMNITCAAQYCIERRQNRRHRSEQRLGAADGLC